MEPVPKKGTLQSMQIIHRAMLLGQILFAAIAFLLKYSNRVPSDFVNIDQVLQVIAVILSFGGYFAGASLLKKKIQQLKNSSADIQTKAATYRSASVLQWALLEGASIFSIICFLLVGNYAFLALAVAVMLLFAMMAPSRLKIMLLLQISEDGMEAF